MATSLSFKGYQIGVRVDGKEVEHYGLTVDESTNTIKCWIPSENEKPFAVHIETKALDEDSAVEVYLDGQRHRAIRWPKGSAFRQTISYSMISATEVRDFKFGTLQSTDDDAYLEKFGCSLLTLGEIRTEIYKIRVLDVKPTKPTSIPEVGIVHERAKKALVHQVQFGEKRQLDEAVETYGVSYLNKLATFIFLYRPLAVLQATDIAPCPSASPPAREESFHPELSSQAAQKRKHSDVKQESDQEGEEQEDDDEGEVILLERLATFQSSFQAEMDKLRNEINEARTRKATKRSKKRVKPEPKLSFIPGEFIDLT